MRISLGDPALGLRASPGDLILGLSWQCQNTQTSYCWRLRPPQQQPLVVVGGFWPFRIFFFIYYECILSCAASLGRYVSERQGDEVN